MEKKWIHVVVRGRRVRLFSSWDEYSRDVLTYSHSHYRKFRTTQEVRDYIASKLDIGEVELWHIQVMVELIRQLTLDNPYVPKMKAGNVATPNFPYAGVKWEAGQFSSNAHAFEPVNTFSGPPKAESMKPKEEENFFEAYPTRPNCFEQTIHRTSPLLGVFCGFCFTIMFLKILILAVLLLLLCIKLI